LDLDIANYKTLLTKYVGIQLIQIERQCIYLIRSSKLNEKVTLKNNENSKMWDSDKIQRCLLAHLRCRSWLEKNYFPCPKRSRKRNIYFYNHMYRPSFSLQYDSVHYIYIRQIIHPNIDRSSSYGAIFFPLVDCLDQ